MLQFWEFGRLSPKLQKQLISELFSENGLEYSIAKTTIAGSDFSNRAYSYHDTENHYNLKHFKLAEEDTKYRVSQLIYSNNTFIQVK